ncbi:MAG: hypothetical protein KAX49_05860 [Halanaerobiales bacterium]|nr:hypothetical protein [Halanaerobiales bacterium]
MLKRIFCLLVVIIMTIAFTSVGFADPPPTPVGESCSANVVVTTPFPTPGGE